MDLLFYSEFTILKIIHITIYFQFIVKHNRIYYFFTVGEKYFGIMGVNYCTFV